MKVFKSGEIINITPTRKVLFEKHSIIIAAEEFFVEQLNSCRKIKLTGSGANSYIWSSGVSNGVTFNPSTTNTYTVLGTDNNGCKNKDSITIVINNSCTEGIQSYSNSSSISIYPVPASDFINIEIPENTSSKISVLSIDGKLIKAITFENEALLKIDVSELNVGFYFINITDVKSGNTVTKKFSVAR